MQFSKEFEDGWSVGSDGAGVTVDLSLEQEGSAVGVPGKDRRVETKKGRVKSVRPAFSDEKKGRIVRETHLKFSIHPLASLRITTITSPSPSTESIPDSFESSSTSSNTFNTSISTQTQCSLSSSVLHRLLAIADRS